VGCFYKAPKPNGVQDPKSLIVLGETPRSKEGNPAWNAHYARYYELGVCESSCGN
jgi:hypothetical protein